MYVPWPQLAGDPSAYPSSEGQVLYCVPRSPLVGCCFTFTGLSTLTFIDVHLGRAVGRAGQCHKHCSQDCTGFAASSCQSCLYKSIRLFLQVLTPKAALHLRQVLDALGHIALIEVVNKFPFTGAIGACLCERRSAVVRQSLARRSNYVRPQQSSSAFGAASHRSVKTAQCVQHVNMPLHVNLAVCPLQLAR